MFKNLPKGLFIKGASIAAPFWLVLAYQNMLSNNITLGVAIAFSIFGIVTTVGFGLGLEGLYSLLSGRTHTPQLDDRLMRRVSS